MCHNDILLILVHIPISFWYFSSNRILMYRDKNHNFLIYVILMEDNLRKVKIFSSLQSTQYSWDQNWKKNVATNIKSLRAAAVISKTCALFLSLLYSQWSNSAQWRIELFSNFGSILIDLKDKPTTEEIYTWKFFYNITTLWCLFFVVLARDSNFFFLLFKSEHTTV